MKKFSRLSMLFISLLFTVSGVLHAQIQMPAMFSDNMVLQQLSDAPIWGKAAPNTEIKINPSWNKKTYNIKADGSGKWMVKIKTPMAGGPYEITISDKTSFKLKNVMIGEVWLCSGQSNMEMPLSGWGKVLNFEQEIAEARYPNIRLLQVEKATSLVPLDDIKVSGGSWQQCSPTSVSGFSATAYFFGRNLYQNLNVPIGLIHTSWGGTVAEAWTSAEALEMMPYFRKIAADKKDNPNNPTSLYNAMIHPIIPYKIKGAIWYQGESNAERANQYNILFPLMINDWRTKWNDNFAFYFVQLANFKQTKDKPEDSDWAELREAQLNTLNLEHTGMAVTIDIGDANDIHPENKQDVGNRLAIITKAKSYGKNITYSGPLFKSYRIEGNKIRISFNHTEGGLRIKDGNTLKGFSIAGPDKQFYWAEAMIEGNDVIVSSSDVAFPIAVRYAWADNPVCNLYNGANLPASPFRTDNWKEITYNAEN